MITEKERKYIDAIIFRVNAEVLKVMERIPENELYGRKKMNTLKFPKEDLK